MKLQKTLAILFVFGFTAFVRAEQLLNSEEQNVDLIHHFLEGTPEEQQRLMNPEVQIHDLITGQVMTPLQAVKEITQEIDDAFEQKLQVNDLIASEDKVVVYWTWHGIHNKGAYWGILPTDQAVSVSGINIYRITNGQINEIWGRAYDRLRILEQIADVTVKTKGAEIMIEQDNIKLVKRLFEGMLLESNLANYEEFFVSDVLIHGPATGQETRGLSTGKKIDEGYAKAFERTHIGINDIFACEDRVVVNWTASAIHNKQEYEGIQPTNRSGDVSGISIYRLREGKIVEIWQSWDRLGLLEQIGEVYVTSNYSTSNSQKSMLKSLGMEKYCEQASLLSKRERQCLQYLMENKTAKETASLLDLSQRTVESYYENIKTKLNCWTKKELYTTAQILKKLNLL